ncbi:MAG: Fe-Mn family superoxide dismutase, partial [bacterium]
MKKFEEKKFNIGQLKGISAKNVEEHLKLYAGYVNNTNLVLTKIEELSTDAEKNMGLLSGLQKRLGFEYNGMRNHEKYFYSLSGGPHPLSENSELRKQIVNDFGSFDSWLVYFKAIATTRGVGWAMLYFDKKENRLMNAWIDEQHLGQLQECSLILALDMWEHSFIFDYQPSGKKQ